MTFFDSIILGIVEGLTEYLPVSSTGHLLLVQRMLGIESSTAADAYAISIQGGAILAVLSLYYRRVLEMMQGVAGRNPEGFRLARNIVVAFLPAAFIGLLLEKPIKRFLFGEEWGLWPVIGAWFVGGVAILAVGFYRKARNRKGVHGVSLAEMTLRMALIIGFAQCIAMWPGVSRSLVTIVGGILAGLSLPVAVEFSFLLGVVTLGAATAYDALRHGEEMIREFGLGTLIAGFLAAWISAMLAVKWMVSYLKSHGLALFGYYRIALALLVAAAILLGWISD